MVAFEVERTKVGLDTLLLVTVRQPGPWVQGVTSRRLVTMTTTYSGPARLILVDGTCISGMASLKTNQSGGLNGWGGSFRPDELTTDLRNAVEGLQLELPYDQIGTVAVTGIRKLLATQVLMSLAGRGPAPF